MARKRLSDIKDIDIFENGRVVYGNNVRLNKRGRRAERIIEKRAWKHTYSNPRFINHSKIKERSYSRLHTSSYWFDFAVGNLRSFVVVFLLFIGFYMVAMRDNIENLNPFETGISILQEISDMGYDAKSNMVDFVKSINAWSDGNGEWFHNIPIFSNVLTKLLSSIFYSIGAIWNFLKFIFRLIILVFRLLLGGL